MHMVDRKYHPTELVRDKFWDSTNVSLPHTADSKKLQSTQMIGSVFNIDIQSTMISPATNPGEAVLPALAEVDEDNTSDVRGESGTLPGDGNEQDQVDG
ncbi:hypothetical protein EGR_04390 [Echinococcus granulosus]|uniref:Uncharacterized protein n=1 Tax=Echinococcus granulosus TaxID=6210 RepID=W6V3X4_ECHGR|nr:hypothetical protein EGR_04390 [Echinococcus granulosus]EUB60764.1 hypothetical protein EGR_04390 [Echinococcus granulosus]